MKVLFPLRTGRGLNGREHHMVRARRVQDERWAVVHAIGRREPPAGPVIVNLWRVSPSAQGLDGDNLEGALKAVRDQVAAWLKRDDADPSIDWRYAQATVGKGVWMVGIDVEPWVDYVAPAPNERVLRLGRDFLGAPVPVAPARRRKKRLAA